MERHKIDPFKIKLTCRCGYSAFEPIVIQSPVMNPLKYKEEIVKIEGNALKTLKNESIQAKWEKSSLIKLGEITEALKEPVFSDGCFRVLKRVIETLGFCRGVLFTKGTKGFVRCSGIGYDEGIIKNKDIRNIVSFISSGGYTGKIFIWDLIENKKIANLLEISLFQRYILVVVVEENLAFLILQRDDGNMLKDYEILFLSLLANLLHLRLSKF